RWTFPRRNWTIAALAETVVVVEAGHDSGALITARAAVDLRRPVHAVPGPLGASTWIGANRLIADGRATLLADPCDLLTILGLAVETSAQRPRSLADRALELLAAGPVDLDQVATELGLHAAAVATLLAEMVILGLVTPTGDGRLARR
ncbi:MAG: DNA-processing protein DprA, partial [Chloroflexota bacterium]